MEFAKDVIEAIQKNISSVSYPFYMLHVKNEDETQKIDLILKVGRGERDNSEMGGNKCEWIFKEKEKGKNEGKY